MSSSTAATDSGGSEAPRSNARASARKQAQLSHFVHHNLHEQLATQLPHGPTTGELGRPAKHEGLRVRGRGQRGQHGWRRRILPLLFLFWERGRSESRQHMLHVRHVVLSPRRVVLDRFVGALALGSVGGGVDGLLGSMDASKLRGSISSEERAWRCAEAAITCTSKAWSIPHRRHARQHWSSRRASESECDRNDAQGRRETRRNRGGRAASFIVHRSCLHPSFSASFSGRERNEHEKVMPHEAGF